MFGAQNENLLCPPKNGCKSAKSKMSFAHPTWSLLQQKTIRFCLKLRISPHAQVAHGHMLFVVHLKARPGLVRIATVAVALEI